MVRIRVALVATFALAACLTACGEKNQVTNETTTTTSVVTSTPPQTATESPGSSSGISIPPSVTKQYLTGVRVENAGAGTDRVIFSFDGGLPGYTLSQIERPLRNDGEGSTLEINGVSVLQIVFADASAAKLDGGFVRTYSGPDRITGDGPVREVVKVGDFEGRLSWGIGVDSNIFDVSTSDQLSQISVIVGPSPTR